jgi:apolipoprotein N-acyltransferase
MSTTLEQREEDLERREERLVSVLAKARRRSGRVVTERWLAAAGGALVLAGLMLVIIGWVGTSRTVLVAGQIPYVVSGGLLGLGLVFLGGFLYFAYWLALSRADVVRLETQLEDVNRTLTTIAEYLRGSRG